MEKGRLTLALAFAAASACFLFVLLHTAQRASSSIRPLDWHGGRRVADGRGCSEEGLGPAGEGRPARRQGRTRNLVIIVRRTVLIVALPCLRFSLFALAFRFLCLSILFLRYKSEIVQVDKPGGKVFVHFAGWEDKWNEWIPVTALCKCKGALAPLFCFCLPG